MLLSVTKIELKSYSNLLPFFKLNGQIISELKHTNCKKYKMTGSLNLRVWYTMTLWENENDLNDFYRNGTHLQAMKQARTFSSKIKSYRLSTDDLIKWNEAKKNFK